MDVLVIGAGPAGLMAAEVLASRGREVTIVDSKPSFGRKFLMAGKSGLNITKEESFDCFMQSFREDKIKLEPILKVFGPEQIKKWVQDVGQEIFFGSTSSVTSDAIPFLKLLIPLATSPIKLDIFPRPNSKTTNITTIAICQIPMLIKTYNSFK